MSFRKLETIALTCCLFAGFTVTLWHNLTASTLDDAQQHAIWDLLNLAAATALTIWAISRRK